MMSLPRFASALVVTLLGVIPAQAASKSECVKGSCSDKGEWVVCITYDDRTGRLEHAAGTACDGVHWTDGFTIVDGQAPLAGPDRHTITGKGWTITYVVAPGAGSVKIWGTDATGREWRAHFIPASGKPGASEYK